MTERQEALAMMLAIAEALARASKNIPERREHIERVVSDVRKFVTEAQKRN